MENHQFLHPSIRLSNVDRFIHRQALLDQVSHSHDFLFGRCLDVGCGNQPYKSLLLKPPFTVTEVLGIDQKDYSFNGINPDLYWVSGKIPAPDNSFESSICTEVLEHCPNASTILREIYRVLKPGGCLLITVPFLWPLHEVPNDWCRYTPFSFKHLLENEGFNILSMRPLGGYDKSLGQMLGLWLRRRRMNRFLRLVLTLLFYPLWTLLRLSNETLDNPFSEGQMITGLVVRVQKPCESES